jgi:ABC-2 type transport system ATP-binding protein
MTVGEHLAFLAQFYPTWDAAYTGDLARRLGLPLGDKVGTLSKGTKVKLAFVAAEAFRPPVLLLDEPTSGLDPVVRREVIDAILERFPDAGSRLVVFSTHILEDVEGLAERVVVLADGAVRRDATIAELRREQPDETLSNILYGILTNGTPPTRRVAGG